MKIFIVDDSAAIRERLRDALESIPNVEFTGEADNENEALEKISRKKQEPAGRGDTGFHVGKRQQPEPDATHQTSVSGVPGDRTDKQHLSAISEEVHGRGGRLFHGQIKGYR